MIFKLISCLPGVIYVYLNKQWVNNKKLCMIWNWLKRKVKLENFKIIYIERWWPKKYKMGMKLYKEFIMERKLSKKEDLNKNLLINGQWEEIKNRHAITLNKFLIKIKS
jgi:hypothetical protein